MCSGRHLGLIRSTNINNNNSLTNLSTLSIGPDCLRTAHPEVDFNVSSFVGATFTKEKVLNCHVSTKRLRSSSVANNLQDCQVVLNDILSCGQTEKSKTLKTSQDKYHSAPSRQPNDNVYLETLARKDPIAWPSMKDNERWNQLDNNVYSLLVGGSTVYDRVALLETSIYSQASLLFGHWPPPKKGLRGLNRRAQHSIKLVIEKNNLLGQIKSCQNEASKISLGELLKIVHKRLQNVRRGQKSRKRRWKIKQASKNFFKNPYDAGKNVLDPKCDKKLSCSQTQLDQHKSKILSDHLFNSPLPHLQGLPPAPTPTDDFNISSLKKTDWWLMISPLFWILVVIAPPQVLMMAYLTRYMNVKCPKLMLVLFKIFKSCAKLSFVPVRWRIASEVYIPKVNPPKVNQIEDFRPIAIKCGRQIVLQSHIKENGRPYYS